MPIITVKMFKGRTKAQKAELARVITEAVVTIAQTKPESTMITFEDVDKENWAVAGELQA